MSWRPTKKRLPTQEDKELDSQIEKLEQSIKALESKGIDVPDSMAESLASLKSKRSPNKINAQKIVFEGIEYDSKREARTAKALKEAGLKFEYQVEVELQPAFKLERENIQDICIIVDFLVEEEFMVDVKGHIMDVFKLKWKMLKHKYKDTMKYHIIQKESDIQGLIAIAKLSRWKGI